jgi:hypothetical protein
MSFQARLLSLTQQTATSENDARYSVSTADPDIVCVLPKSRTPTVGCTLRSLSHNLALLPPRGLARAYWLQSEKPSGPGDAATDSLNCLLIPFPYSISARCFEGHREGSETWGWFELNPNWCLPTPQFEKQSFSAFLKFVMDLVERAKRDVGEVHAIVFPESSLSSATFRALAAELETNSKVELLVAGLFDLADEDGKNVRRGNFAALAVLGEDGLTSFREKHHRWRLDQNQIQTYALGSALDPSVGWWENIDILSRSLDIYVLRGTTTVTTLICEDLARTDPCQELVRGIGPNLVFALLMDGPQLKARWPSRYATVLAEDPGSSVLSLTSLGLIQRSNAAGRVPSSRVVGLWRDDRGDSVELQLPEGAHALCLSLRATGFSEHTLDGRDDANTSESWRMVGIQPVTAACPNMDILNGQWPNVSRNEGQ